MICENVTISEKKKTNNKPQPKYPDKQHQQPMILLLLIRDLILIILKSFLLEKQNHLDFLI